MPWFTALPSLMDFLQLSALWEDWSHVTCKFSAHDMPKTVMHVTFRISVPDLQGLF